MAAPRALAWIKPWMVVALMTVVAGGGATGVYFAGEAQHRRDRADIVAWGKRALPAARDASAVRDRLRSAMPLDQVNAARLALERDVATLLAPPLPEVVRPAAAAYTDAIRKTEASLEAVGSPAFAQAWTRAGSAFVAAAGVEQNVVCRARLPACARL